MKLVESFFISLNWLNFWPLDRLTDCYTMQESESQEGRKEGEGGQPAISQGTLSNFNSQSGLRLRGQKTLYVFAYGAISNS